MSSLVVLNKGRELCGLFIEDSIWCNQIKTLVENYEKSVVESGQSIQIYVDDRISKIAIAVYKTYFDFNYDHNGQYISFKIKREYLSSPESRDRNAETILKATVLIAKISNLYWADEYERIALDFRNRFPDQANANFCRSYT